MSNPRNRPALGMVLYSGVIFALGCYFTFAAVQGEYGLFRRLSVEAQTRSLTAERDALALELAEMQNKTRRLSDDYLDLDLLDEQARTVLGMIRADEIVIR